MTAQEVEQYFQYHNSNIRLLKIGFDQIRNQLKNLYKIKDNQGGFIFSLSVINSEKLQKRKIEKALNRILSGIQVSWAEESIKRLWYEKSLFTDKQRTHLIGLRALDQRWYKTLEIVFCIAYGLVPANDETCSTVNIKREKKNLGNGPVEKYFELKDIIKNHLAPNFSIRNKVQHGEWEFAFKPPLSFEFSQDLTDKLNNENIVTTTSRHNLVNAFYQMIVDLGRFKSKSFKLDPKKTPFEHFYEHYIHKIKYEVSKISNPNLEIFIKEMLEKKIRGQQHSIK